MTPWRKRIEEWKGKYEGQRCFCVGNGPSLRVTPLELLKGEKSFGLNRVADIYPHTTWRPTFYVNVTVMTQDPGWAQSAREAMKYATSFIGWHQLPFLVKQIGNLIILPDNVVPINVSKSQNRHSFGSEVWSNDIGAVVSKDGTSMVAVMQIAAYMGFNPIYLVGCDASWKTFDYNGPDPNHFSDEYWGKPVLQSGRKVVVSPELANQYTQDALRGHQAVKEACDRLGIEVYNATVGGELEVYPRVRLEDVCSSLPS